MEIVEEALYLVLSGLLRAPLLAGPPSQLQRRLQTLIIIAS